METKNEIDSLLASLCLQALDKLPEKKLIFGENVHHHSFDLMGALSKLQRPNDTRFMFEFVAERTGLTSKESERQLKFLIALNDDQGCTEAQETRYARVRKYLEDIINGV